MNLTEPKVTQSIMEQTLERLKTILRNQSQYLNVHFIQLNEPETLDLIESTDNLLYHLHYELPLEVKHFDTTPIYTHIFKVCFFLDININQFE